MKKIWVLLLVGFTSLCFMTGCSSKEKSDKKKSSEESALVSKKKKKTTSSETKDREQSKSSTSQALDEQKEEVPEILSGYSDLQIEYARVWLAVMGENFIPYMSSPDFDFTLNVDKIPAGTPIDQYDEGSVSYPEDVMILSGNITAEGMVVYSSNHNGSINQYNVPSHWHLEEPYRSDPAYIEQITQQIIDERQVIEIPAGDPELVKQLIDVTVIH